MLLGDSVCHTVDLSLVETSSRPKEVLCCSTLVLQRTDLDGVFIAEEVV